MLYHWLVQASLLIVKIQTDLDDQASNKILIKKKMLICEVFLISLKKISCGLSWPLLYFLRKVILDGHCEFLIRALKLVLSPKMRHLETDFTIDLRNFKNFQLRDQNLEEEEEEDLEEQGILVTIVIIIISDT